MTAGRATASVAITSRPGETRWARSSGRPNSRLCSICSKISRSPRNVVAGWLSPFKLAGSG